MHHKAAGQHLMNKQNISKVYPIIFYIIIKQQNELQVNIKEITNGLSLATRLISSIPSTNPLIKF